MLKKALLYLSLFVLYTQCTSTSDKNNKTQDNTSTNTQLNKASSNSIMHLLAAIDTQSQTPFTQLVNAYHEKKKGYSAAQNDSLFFVSRAWAAKELYARIAVLENDSNLQYRLDSALTWLSNKEEGFIDVVVAHFDSTLYISYVQQIKDTVIKNFLLNKWNEKMIIDYSEGYWYLKYYPSMMKDVFYPLCSPDINDFLILSSKYDQQKYADDGGLVIEPIQLVDRVVDWEIFYNKYPSTQLKAELQMMLTYYTRTVFAGMDNTPAFDYDTGRLGSEYYEAWLYIIEKYPDSHLNKILNTFNTQLKENSYTLHEGSTYYTDLDTEIAKIYGSER